MSVAFDTKSEFFKSSKQIAEKFLQTAIVIDDQAKFSDDDIQPEQNQILSSPRGRKNELDNLPENESDEKNAHDLNAQTVINSFAEKNIICSVIKPPDADNAVDLVKNLVFTADIVVLDWNLYGDDGDTILSLLKASVSKADSSPAQLRLFTIYTGEPDIEGISKKVHAAIKVTENDKPFIIDTNATRILILAKPNANIRDDFEAQKVEFEDLVERVITEFTIITAGLVSNVAINAFAELRKNVFRILERFGQSLDAPYLTHRLLQPTPEDAEDLLVALLTEEIQALLEESLIGKSADYSNIEKWFDTQPHIEKVNLFQGKELSKDIILSMLKDGVSNFPKKFPNGEKMEIKQEKKWHKNVTKDFTSNSDLDDDFAELTTIRSFYDNTDRILSLGTILKRVGSTDYILCLSPKCDNVRLDKLKTPRKFPFIPLRIDKHRFSIVCNDIENPNNYLRFMPKAKPFSLQLIAFSPDKNGEKDKIIAKVIDNKFIFTDNEKDSQGYIWIGELRTEHALRIVQELANNFARVGLNESEWLRLSAK